MSKAPAQRLLSGEVERVKRCHPPQAAEFTDKASEGVKLAEIAAAKL